jgi:hypothetical protein
VSTQSPSGLDFLLRTHGSIAEAEHAFEKLTNCTSCSCSLTSGLVYRRAYELRGGCTALVILCGACNDQLPHASVAERQFRAGLERMAASNHQPTRNLQ